MSDFAEGLISGVLGGVSGGAGAMANIYKNERENAARVDTEAQLEQIRSQILLDRQKQIDQYKADRQRAEGAAVSTAQQGIINARTENMAQGFDQSNPDAAAFIRNERGADELETAQAGNQAAGKLGLLDRQKEFGDQIKDINTKNAADRRYDIEAKKNDERDAETARHNKAMEAIQSIAKKDGADADTARIKNAKYILENNIAKTPAEAWEKASELGGKNAEDVILATAQKIKADADKNLQDMTYEQAVEQAKGLMSAVRGGKAAAPAKPQNRKPLSSFNK